MRGLHDTISRLASRKRSAAATGAPPVTSRLRPMGAFGSNPGALKGLVHVPASYQRGNPLVVVLHGCTQTAAGYDHGTGWSSLADEQGFILLFPEQQRANNPNLCFNWFDPEDIRRGSGEALSIRQMIHALQVQHGTDPHRTFVTGLSAGGAMTAVMLATYPEIFAGGAVIAGLPYGTAHSVPEAFDRMRGAGGPGPGALPALVRSASAHKGPWPSLSVWHGSGDTTVVESNAEALVGQWRALHALPSEPARTERGSGYSRRVWEGAEGRPVIEQYRLSGLGHGTPVDPRLDEVPGPFFLEAGISSTRHIAAFWGIADLDERDIAKSRESHAADFEPAFASGGQTSHLPTGIGKTIEDALRSAGLMR